MKRAVWSKVLLVATALALVVPVRANSQQADGNQLVVVLHARNPTRRMTTEQLKNLMLGNVSFWHGVVPVKVFVRPPNSPAAQVLFDKVIEMPASRFNEHWTAKQLAGQGIAPTVLATPEQVAAEVAKVPGAIGVILQSEAWNAQLTGVNVIPLN
ncbi:MAG: hypothetical protein JNM69_18960 [Archangium sp.]|nr:hypothetical protein [Archangium sp.]